VSVSVELLLDCSERPARTSASPVFFFRLRSISVRAPLAFNKPATPVPTASETFLVAPVVESATAVAAPVNTPVAMLWRLTAFRTDLPRLFVAFFDFLLMAKRNRMPMRSLL
jgi:hypothetical protein